MKLKLFCLIIISSICFCHVHAQKFTQDVITLKPNYDASIRKLEPSIVKTPRLIGKDEGDAKNIELAEIKDDIKIKITGATASSFQDGSGIEYTYDGDYGTSYHSNWSNHIPNYYPINLKYLMDNENLNYIIYHPTGSHNGHFKEFKIYATTNGVEDKVAERNLTNSGSTPIKIKFDQQLKGVTSVRFEVLSGYGNNEGYATCSEMEFYNNSVENFDLLSLFADESCSALKSGITIEDINSCSNLYYKEIASLIYNKKYPTDFRINSYKPWMHPNVSRDIVNNWFSYSLLDNPTGVTAKRDVELIVFVGGGDVDDLKIKIQNLDQPGGDGYDGSSSSYYYLRKGANKIKPRNDGLIYVMYHVYNENDLANKKPLNIHFATGGEVNGYYDSQIHTEEDWSRLLNSATNKYFDVLGKYAHLTFPTASFKEHTPNGKVLIDLYDRIVKEEQIFKGLEKYNKMHKNRSYFHVMYHQYMYATWYKTGYTIGTMSLVCNPEKLIVDTWGPAHEVGHTNQMNPATSWRGMSEVSVNIFSMYIMRILGNPSRLEKENRYAAAHAFVAAKKDLPHVNIGCVFSKLVPFWQLYLYCSVAKGDHDFYKDLHEKLRINPLPATTDGEAQLQFVRLACETANCDLTEFFEYWGFFTPVYIDGQLYDGEMKITKVQADATKAAIAAKNYRKPVDDIWKITDSNTDHYR